MLNSFLIGILTSGILKIYTDNINKKRHIIDREKVPEDYICPICGQPHTEFYEIN